jgi:ribonuclease D
MSTQPIELVSTQDAVSDLSRRLAALEWVALDTEFLREETYYPRLCLLQLGWPGGVACVDPLLGLDLEPLVRALVRPELLKVWHASRQDLEMLAHLWGSVPAPLFDTQLAAPLVGLPEQMGYAALVERRLGIQLDKAHTRADWTRRPLPPAWLEYAADDVRHLAAIFPGLRDELARRGRLAWLEPEFSRLADRSAYQVDPAEAWRRLKGTERLNPRQRGAVVLLAEWRERTAQAADRPRGWILKDETIIDIARALPADREALAGIRGLPERTLARHGEALLAAVAAGRSVPGSPAGLRRAPLGEEQEALVDAAMAVVRLAAARADINPSLLASRRQLELWVAGEAMDEELLEGWRAAILRAPLTALKEGRLGLRARGGGLETFELAREDAGAAV